jgi:ectoine hydroxylase-related dioxygenase (phytanoyl-CoA dioxygenase family)
MLAPPELLRRDPGRKQDAWFFLSAVRELACHPAVLDALRFLYGREPIPFQTLNFAYGTEQPAHSDQVHFSSMPSGFMCGVWVALEDTTLDNGPLFYYPGSQRVADVQLHPLGMWAEAASERLGENCSRYEGYLASLMEAHHLAPKPLLIRRGQAMVWSANLVHGGSPIRKPGATRMSQVTHYFFERCVYYTPILSDALLGEYFLRDRVADIRTGLPVEQSFNGQRLRWEKLPNGNHRLVRDRA